MTRKHAIRCLGVLVCCCAASLFCGCGVVNIAPESQVEKLVKEHGAALATEKWQKALRYYHPKMEWEREGTITKGAAAARGYVDSVRTIQGIDDFYTTIHRVKKLSETRVAVSVTFKAHRITSSMQLKFSNLAWNANMLWIRQGKQQGTKTVWKIARIVDTTQRKRETSTPGGV